MRNTRKSGQILRSEKCHRPTGRSGRGRRTNSNIFRQILARVIEAVGRHKIATGVGYGLRRRTTIAAVRSRGVPSMCDYSLYNVASRPAKVGDRLVTTQFNNSITRGFAAVGEPNVAVCLLPGTEIAFETDVEWRSTKLGLFCRKQ